MFFGGGQSGFEDRICIDQLPTHRVPLSSLAGEDKAESWDLRGSDRLDLSLEHLE